MKHYLIVLMAIAGLVACSDQEQAAPPAAGKEQTQQPQGEVATVLLFQERERGIPPYGGRVIVTEAWLRMDDGNDQGDYLLFDRKTRDIYSVAHEDQTILEIAYHPVTIEPPYALNLVSSSETDESSPSIGGNKPTHTTFSVNSKRCFDVVTVPGVLDDAAKALGEYTSALAGEQARNLHKTPKEFQDPCMLSNLIFHTDERFKDGFPIREWNNNGYIRELMDYRQDYPVDPAIFTLPQAYERYKLEAMPDQAPVEAKGV